MMKLSRRLIVIATALFTAVTLVAQTTHKVTRIVDGDTLVLSELGTVRLIGVDTPETVDPRRPVEEFGKQSSGFLTALALNKTVRVEYDQTRKDRYGRTLAYLFLEDGRMVNEEIIRFGYGHAYVKYPFKYMARFEAVAREAQKLRLGLWGARLGPEDVVTIATTPAAAPMGLLSTAAVGGAAVGGAVGAATVATAAAPFTAKAGAGNGEVTVYVTKTGEKYHQAGCRSLARSSIPMTLKDAATRYGACSICRPPVLSESATSAALPLTSSPRATPAPAAPN
jgi:micrococcal nuclease